MTITAKLIEDSYNFDNEVRLTTLQLRYPRYIHAELMTHRVFSRSASSSRAIPVSRLIKDVLEDRVYPSFWGKNQPGMQADEELSEFDIATCKGVWDEARDAAVEHAVDLDTIGAHKQIVNRILEPFSHINVIVTSTEWENFYKLRIHEDAQPAIRELASQMWQAMYDKGVTPKGSYPGTWHLPYITEEDKDTYSVDVLCKMSAARCARVSYSNHDGTSPNMENDLKLFDRLTGSDPKHLSPTEHQAVGKVAASFYGNFRGWMQFRKQLEA